MGRTARRRETASTGGKLAYRVEGRDGLVLGTHDDVLTAARVLREIPEAVFLVMMPGKILLAQKPPVVLRWLAKEEK